MLSVVDCHAEGEVGKVIVGGVGQVPGQTMFDKKLYLERNMDDIRKMALFEPRGAAWHNANIILPSNNPEAAMGYVILESTEYPAMSGSNTSVATVLLETGILSMQEPVTELTLEAPAGLIKVRCACKDGKVTSVQLVNQPAFCYRLDARIEVAGRGTVTVDIAFGGMTFAIVDGRSLGFDIVPAEARQLCEIGEKIKAAAAEQLATDYPGNPDMPGITITQITAPLQRENGVVVSRNTYIVSPGRCDRSPTGTGCSARLAVMHAKGQIKPGETFVHHSITGSKFICGIKGLAKVGPCDAVIPSVAGQAWITGLNQIGMDATDPYPNGFTLSGTWLREFGARQGRRQPARRQRLRCCSRRSPILPTRITRGPILTTPAWRVGTRGRPIPGIRRNIRNSAGRSMTVIRTAPASCSVRRSAPASHEAGSDGPSGSEGGWPPALSNRHASCRVMCCQGDRRRHCHRSRSPCQRSARHRLL